MFSRRAEWNPTENLLTVARREVSGDVIDLTESNPTHTSIAYPLDALSDIYARAARARYEPHALGLPSAREALAETLGGSPDDFILTASTSEAYSYLFKLLADPGDNIVTAVPSYPLLAHLAQLESVEQRFFSLDLQHRWETDPSRITATDRTRAIVVVNPNNPTGSLVTMEEQSRLLELGIPVISDEVFIDYPIAATPRPIESNDVLAFGLGGLSKSAGLPHLKLGWIRLSGAPGRRAKALAALELIADSYLSVSTPVQAALPELLRIAPAIRERIAGRVRGNLDALQLAIADRNDIRVLPLEAGWSACLRVPATEGEEDLVLGLLRDQCVVTYPGFFFDFPFETVLVLSLLTEPDHFNEGVRRILHVTTGDRWHR